MTSDLTAARKWFAEDLREAAPVRLTPAVIEAFARVPREAYLGPGPWMIHGRLGIGAVHESASDAAHHLYHDLLVSIDAASGINNGLPSLWALVFDHLGLRPGTRVLQVGAGVGYYTAILAELVGETGHVLAYEIDPRLAERAQAHLAQYAQVELVARDATVPETLPPCDALTACAGVTHVPSPWLNSLVDGGQMVLPVTGENHWGMLMHLERKGAEYPVKSLGPCGFYPCAGARSDAAAAALSAAFGQSQPGPPPITAYHRGTAPEGQRNIWSSGPDFWIEQAN